MPNVAQTPTEEEEGSGGESPEEWDSDADDDDEGRSTLYLLARKDARSLSMIP